MLARVFCADTLAILAGAFAVQLAHADTFLWVDSSGMTNVSNIAPPDGVKVTKVFHSSAPSPAARDAQLQALTSRVQELETELELTRRQPPPPPAYPTAFPALPAMPYPPVRAAPPVQYDTEEEAPSAYAGCDPTWTPCGLWAPPIWYPSSVVVLPAHFRRFNAYHFRHHFAARPPMHAYIASQHFPARVAVRSYGGARRR